MIFLSILKWVGIAVLILLGLIILFILLLLFVPFRYRVNARVNTEEKVYDGIMDVTWLLHLLHAKALANLREKEKLKFGAKLLGIQVFPRKKKKKKEEAAPPVSQEEAAGSQEPGAPTDSEGKDDAAPGSPELMEAEGGMPGGSGGSSAGDAGGSTSGENAGAGEGETEGGMSSGSPESAEAEGGMSSGSPESAEAESGHIFGSPDGKDTDKPEEILQIEGTGSDEKKEKKKGIKDKLLGLIRKIGSSVEKIIAKIKSLFETAEYYVNLYEDPRTQRSIGLVLREKDRVWRATRPRKISARLHFGLNDPGTTGQVAGYLSLADFLYGKNIIIEPDFDAAIFDGELTLKGRVRLITFVITFFKLYFNRDIKWLRRNIKKI